MKTLKKYVAMLALASLVLGPVQALAQTSLDPDPTTVNTGFTFGGGGATGNTLAIKAVWQDVDENPLTDDTQINPPSNCGLTKPVTVCAVVQDDSLSYGMEKTAVDAAIDGRAWLYYDSLLGGTDNFANASNASNLAYLVGGNINNYFELRNPLLKKNDCETKTCPRRGV